MITPSQTPVVGFFTPLPGAAAILAAAGFKLLEQPPPAPGAADAPAVEMPVIQPMPRIQQRIVLALTRQPALNERQVAILETYWAAYHESKQALPISEIAARLVKRGIVDPARADNFVKGALRSFGKRLNGFANEPVAWVSSVDRCGDGIADPVPLVVLMEIRKGKNGEACHRLTTDGATAVAAALGLPKPGPGAADDKPGKEDLDEVVSLGMSRRAAVMILRVAKTRGISTDEAIIQMTAAAGAG